MARILSESKKLHLASERAASARALAVGRPSIVDLLSGISHHPAGVLAVMLALVALALTLYLIQVSQVATLGYQLNQAQARELQLRVQAETLRTLVAEYEKPRRVEAVARQQLGLVPPEHVVYLTVEGLKDSEPRQFYGVTNRWWAEFPAASNGH